MVYEGWVNIDRDKWLYYNKITRFVEDYNVFIHLIYPLKHTKILIYENARDSESILSSKLSVYFKDLHNPTKNELRMFELRYGIDLSEPLGVKK